VILQLISMITAWK